MTDHDDRGARLISRETIHQDFVRLDRLRIAVHSPAGRAEIEREVHSHGHVAAVLPVDPQRRTAILVRQFRTAPFLGGEPAWLSEIPAGIVDDESPEACAAREAHEETGVELGEISSLGAIWPSPGAIFERLHLFWGTYAGPPPATLGGRDDESEMIEIVECGLGELRAMCVDGRIADAKTALAVLRLAALRPALFD